MIFAGPPPDPSDFLELTMAGDLVRLTSNQIVTYFLGKSFFATDVLKESDTFSHLKNHCKLSITRIRIREIVQPSPQTVSEDYDDKYAKHDYSRQIW